MSAFIQHLPCPNCGSKDNLGEYEDHFYCFGCKFHKHKSDTISLRKRLERKHETVYTPVEDMVLTEELPSIAKQWLLKYGITMEDAKEYNLQWNPNMNMLMLMKTKYYWQARLFDKARPKYLSKGRKPIQIYGHGKNRVVLCEDILSAIKLARVSREICASPLLGSTISFEALRYYKKRYDRVTIWLDRDKAKESVKISKLFQQYGTKCDVIITPLDPKEYNRKELRDWLNYKS